MIKRLLKGIRDFLWNEDAAVKMGSKIAAQLRTIIMAAGLSAAFFSKEVISSGAFDPKYDGKIKLGGVVLAAISLLLRAGDKTPDEVKALVSSAITTAKESA